MEKYNVKKEDVIYIGDDINDIECLQFVANPVTVPNAHISVKSIENISITETCGGNGAVREVADLLI